MAEILEKLEIRLPEPLEEITEKSLAQCVSWGYNSKQLSKITEKFKEEIFKKYFNNRRNISGKIEKKINFGSDFLFNASMVLRDKKISYSGVYSEIENYLVFLLGQYQDGIPREGVLTIENEPYVICNDLILKIKKNIHDLKGAKVAEKRFRTINPVLGEIPSLITIIRQRDYSILDSNNAEFYVKAEAILEEGKNRIKLFKDFSLKYALKLIGKGEIGEIATIKHQFSAHSYLQQLEPQMSVKYGEIISLLIGDEDKKTIGDLEKAMDWENEGKKEKLKVEGLIDDEFIRDYNPKVRDGIVRIRLEGILSRLSLYKEKFSSKYTEQNIILVPN